MSKNTRIALCFLEVFCNVENVLEFWPMEAHMIRSSEATNRLWQLRVDAEDMERTLERGGGSDPSIRTLRDNLQDLLKIQCYGEKENVLAGQLRDRVGDDRYPFIFQAVAELAEKRACSIETILERIMHELRPFELDKRIGKGAAPAALEFTRLLRQITDQQAVAI
jgi:hypothetical protein